MDQRNGPGAFARLAAAVAVVLALAACAESPVGQRRGDGANARADVPPPADGDAAAPSTDIARTDDGSAPELPSGCRADRDCDDSNPCTVDVCSVSGACVQTPVAGPCDDGDGCTTEDTCLAGVCSGLPVTCVDGDDDPCTDAVCQAGACTAECRPDLACVAECAGDADCDDGDPTSIDLCAVRPCSASCTHYWPPCDDGNPCTADRPDEGGVCRHIPLDGRACDDASACTAADRCVGDACAGVLVTCDDGNPCTADRCHPQTGCVFQALPDGVGCDDGDPCTVQDRCQDSVCGGQARVCPDDGDPCSIERCVSSVGCIVLCRHTGECAPQCVDDDDCHDGQPCTIDRCVPTVCSTRCVHTAQVCDDDDPCTYDRCDPQTGACEFFAFCRQCRVDQDCRDDNACTIDDCTPDLVCDETNFLVCPDDGDPCTIEECDPDVGCTFRCRPDCVEPCQTDGDCADADPCTDDRCVEGACGAWCQHPPLACDPDSPCTIAHCLAGQCVESVPAVVPTLDGAVGEDWHPRSLAAVEGDPSQREDACLSELRLQVDDNLLYVGIDGVALGPGLAIVGYIDVDAGDGRGVRNLSDLHAGEGALEAALAGCARFDAEGFEADFAFGSVELESGSWADERAGWRRLTTAGTMRWMPEGAVVTSLESGSMEAVVTLNALFPDGLPADGAILAVAVLIAAVDECAYVDQSLPDQPAPLDGPAPVVSAVHHFVAQPALLECCASAVDCRDDDPCTTDTCRANGRCQHVTSGCF